MVQSCIASQEQVRLQPEKLRTATLALVGVGLDVPEKLKGLEEIYRIAKNLNKTLSWLVTCMPSWSFPINIYSPKEKILETWASTPGPLPEGKD